MFRGTHQCYILPPKLPTVWPPHRTIPNFIRFPSWYTFVSLFVQPLVLVYVVMHDFCEEHCAAHAAAAEW